MEEGTNTVNATASSILVVDDDPDIQIALSDFLIGEGYQTDVADNGKGAITKIKEGNPFNVVLLDMGLPDIDGLTVLKNLVEFDPSLPIIILTAYSETEKAVGALELGAFAYLKKPYNREELKATISRAIVVKDLEEKTKRIEDELTTSQDRLEHERLLAKQAVQESEGRLQAILDGSPAVIYVKDLQGRYLLVNQKHESLFNVNRMSIKGKTDFDIFPREIAEKFRRNDTAVFDAGAPLESEEVAPHAEGLHTYISNKFPLRNSEGRIDAICGISTDITERKRSEEALRESEERFRQLVEIIREVFWLTNPEKAELLYVSPGYETIWGRSCESLYASPQTWLDAIHPDDRGRIIDAATNKQQLGEYDEEYRIIRTDGSVRWIRDRAFPVKDEAGKVYRIAGIAEDITGLKQKDGEINSPRTRLE